jgi:hypothetical protein
MVNGGLNFDPVASAGAPMSDELLPLATELSNGRAAGQGVAGWMTGHHDGFAVRAITDGGSSADLRELAERVDV